MAMVDPKKQVIGLFGEMQLAMRLHEYEWQVHRAYIDEGIDFVITKYYCPKCKQYSNQLIRHKTYNGKNAKCVTNLCEHCKTTELKVVSRYLQVKTSEGVDTSSPNIKEFSFHPKIRYDMDDIYYVWIAVTRPKKTERKCYFYIFDTSDVKLFDNVNLDTYQVTDNQKTNLRIDINTGAVMNMGKTYNYSCFNNNFFENWSVLD